ncbi:GGDEF domain-containing protein [Candidatus Stoquefichus massiliensis]|uniref:GGDEF domain-containing protein n=1 Tax=Candidatus Stoquefichus massiliensis TaxID=1470350 RepID=UPI00047F8468|nr:GGDEF domain-containing protein [Candidatus Stoquefichus massiliensis]
MNYISCEQLLNSFNDIALFQYDCFTYEMIYYPSVHLFFKVNENKIPVSAYYYEQSQIESIFENQQQYQKGEINLRLLDISDKDIWCTIQYDYILKDEQSYIIGKIMNVDYLYKQIQYFMVKAENDSLTGVFNKHAVELRISEQLKECKKGMLLMMDIDGFKKINDQYGHIYGDDILVWFSSQLKKSFDKDILGRVGGDEFVVFIEEIDDCLLIEKKIEDFMHGLKKGYLDCLLVSISIGISRYPLDGNDYTELFDKADKAMYETKKYHKRFYGFYEK